MRSVIELNGRSNVTRSLRDEHEVKRLLSHTPSVTLPVFSLHGTKNGSASNLKEDVELVSDGLLEHLGEPPRCPLDRAQKDVGYARSSTTQLYDHRGENPEESASFFATY